MEKQFDPHVVVTSGPNKYIGDLSAEKFDDFTMLKEYVLRSMYRGELLLLPLAYDYATPYNMVRGPNGEISGVQRQPICTPLDFTLYPTPLYVRVDSVFFFEEMQEDDRDTYKRFVSQAVAQAEAARAQRRGLVLAGGKQLNLNGI